MEKAYLAESIQFAAECVQKESGRADKAIALRNLAEVLRENPVMSSRIQRLMATKLREMPETPASSDPMDTSSATAIRNRRLAQSDHCECGRVRSACTAGHAKNRNTLHSDK